MWNSCINACRKAVQVCVRILSPTSRSWGHSRPSSYMQRCVSSGTCSTGALALILPPVSLLVEDRARSEQPDTFCYTSLISACQHLSLIAVILVVFGRVGSLHLMSTGTPSAQWQLATFLHEALTLTPCKPGFVKTSGDARTDRCDRFQCHSRCLSRSQPMARGAEVPRTCVQFPQALKHPEA